MISLSDILFRYPDSDFRLKIDDLSFLPGSKTAVIGPSGFGKTTLLYLISGILTPQTGDVRVHKHSLNELNDSERRTFRLTNIGFVFQDFKLLEYLKVKDNILLPYRINKALSLDDQARNRAAELASLLGIESKLAKYPNNLSHGERQRVAVCRALIHDPSIILADEPTGNLDPKNKEKIMQVLFDYAANKGSSMITVTHDHELLRGFDRVIDFQELYTNL